MSMTMDEPTSTHRRAWDAIPWVANGSAAEPLREFVEAHVAACDDCRQELAFQRQLRAGFGVETVSAHDAEPGLQRLWARIDAGPATEAPAPVLPGPMPAPLPVTHRPTNRPAANLTRWLVAAVVVQAIGLVGMLAVRQPPASNPPAAYETLSLAPAARSAATLRFVPAPSLSMAELQTLLARSGTRIVETSADGGIFGLAPATPDATETDAPARSRATSRALAELRAARGVLLVEPIDARP